MTAGMLIDECISSVLVYILPTCPPDGAAVIRGLDSARENEDIVKSLTFHGLPCERINGNVCVSIRTVERALTEQLFTGFDEVWIFIDGVPADNLAPMPAATSDAIDFSSSVPAELVTATKKTKCSILLGDGCGLNYLANDQRFEELIKEMARLKR